MVVIVQRAGADAGLLRVDWTTSSRGRSTFVIVLFVIGTFCVSSEFESYVQRETAA